MWVGSTNDYAMKFDAQETSAYLLLYFIPTHSPKDIPITRSVSYSCVYNITITVKYKCKQWAGKLAGLSSAHFHDT